MKLIYIANARIPTEKAHGIQIMQMCEAFTNAGNEVELVLPQRLNYIKGDPFEYYGVERNFKIKKLPCLDLIPLDRYLGKLSLWIQTISFGFFVLPYLLFKKADIIYTRDKFLLPLCLLKKNIVYEAHDFPKNYFLYLPFLNRLRGMVVITHKLKEFFKNKDKENRVLLIPENKILVAPDAVDLEKFDIKENQEECRKKIALPLDKKIIGYVGRLETMGKEKGLRTLLESFKELKKEIDNVVLCYVGGPLSRVKEYHNFGEEIGIKKEEMIIIDQVSHSKIPYYLKSFDVLVMPFPWTVHYAYYMSPLKLFEYMASKIPIVASDLPSIREILNEGNAILVQPDNPQALAEGIRKILENKNLAEKISEQAYKDVQNYTWDKRAKRIIRFIAI